MLAASLLFAWLTSGTPALVARRPVETDQPVACGIPGYDWLGTELYADSFVVDDDPFHWVLAENCAFAGDFEYAS